MLHSIPYAHTARPDTGVSNAQLGMWLFLASDAMLMASLLSGHVLLRASATSVPNLMSSWPYLVIEGGLLFATMLGLWRGTISGGHHLPSSGLRAGFAGAFDSAGRTVLLGCGLLALLCALAQATEVMARANAGMRPAHHVLIASWFTLVVAHMLHVAAGAAMMAWTARRIGAEDPQRLSARLHAVRLYWYFLVLTWIVLLITFGV